MEKIDIRLDKLVLRNYKGFYTGEDEKGIEITFDKHLTVLIGENGAGKSAVLDAIALFLTKLRSDITHVGETASIYPFPLPSTARKNQAVNNQVEETSIDAFFQLLPKKIIDYVYENRIETQLIPALDEEGNQRYDGKGQPIELEKKVTKQYEIKKNRVSKIGFSIYMEKEKSPQDVSVSKWENHTEQIEDEQIETKLTGDDQKTLELFFNKNVYEPYLANEFRSEDRALPVLIYYGANSIHTNAFGKQEEVDTSIFDTYRDALDATKFSFRQFFAWFDDQQKRVAASFLENKPTDNSKVKFVAQAIAKILNDEKTDYKSLKINWLSTPNEMIITKYDEVTQKEENLSVSQLSSGERTLIALVADLTRRLCLANPNAENPLAGNGIVLIDEIDIHLHPKWQQKVVTKLREIFPNLQFIVTTHSSLILSSIKMDCIRILQEHKIYKIPDLKPLQDFNTYGTNPEKIIRLVQQVEDYMPKDVKDLFTAYFAAINREDIQEAKQIKEQLQDLTYKNHPKILEGQAEIEFKQITSSL